MDKSSGSGGGGKPPHGPPHASIDVLLKLRQLDDQLVTERRVLERQQELLVDLWGTMPGQYPTHLLLRLVVMLDHTAHLARRCIHLTEQRRLLLAANPTLADPEKAKPEHGP